MENKKIKIEIDGKEIFTEIGKTILQTAKENGIEIPNLCNHPELIPNGACRLCLVEVVGEKRPVASCCYPVYDGMKVYTNTEKLINYRRLTLQLIISDHPLDCMTCEKSGDCLLEKYAYQYGIKKIEYSGEKAERKEKNGFPFIVRDYEKCILCGRCVKVCEEIVGANAIDYKNRGFITEIISGFDEILKDTECLFCGNCIEVCPVGSLREISAEGKGRNWEYEKIKAICPYCGVGCGIVAYVKNNEIVKVKGDEDSPVNKGFLCIKGKFGFEYVKDEERLKKPLIKEDGKFKEVSWEEAIDFVYEKLKYFRDNFGPFSIAGLSSAKCTNEENYIFQKFFRCVLKSNNVDHCARLCHSSTVVGLSQTIGSAAMSNSLDEIENYSDCIIITGTNITETQPVTSYRIRKAKEKGAKIIVIDPREIEISKIADIYLQPRYGTDVIVFNGLAKIIVDEKLYNEEFIKERVENFEEYKKFIEKFDLSLVEKIANVKIEDLRKVAYLYSKSKSSVILWSMGITQHITGTENVFTLSNLALLTGQIGKKGAGLSPLRGQNNVQGACDMGCLPEFYPGYSRVDDKNTIEKFENLWNEKGLPDKIGFTLVEMFENVLKGNIKCLYIMGEMPLISDPDILHIKKALEKIDFLIVQDIFSTEVCEFADVVFPALSSFEKEGTFTNTERRVQKISKCIENNNGKPDWWIINEIAKRFGYNWNYNDVWDILREINKTVEVYKGITPKRVKNGDRIQWPCLSEEDKGTETLHIGKFKRGKGILKIVEYKEPYELPDEDYPFILTTGRILTEYHSRTMTGKVKGIKEITGDEFFVMNCEDAEKLGIKEGDFAEIKSRRGSIKLKAKLSRKIQKGVIFIPFHFYANILTHTELDPYSKIPEFKICSCHICKVPPRQ
ncbi:MAG TPA: formate dehydrogenase subunit alpha [bacterium]|nr:formate dehydrogenase subunit alpha [bacterium]HOM27193.1 formate dehydrogenase subunit alpha [bacterium]